MTSLAQLERGVVGYWCPMLATTGLRLYDRSVRKKPGTLTNMEASDWVTAKVRNTTGRVLDFDGSNEYIQTTDLPILGSATQLSIAVWVRPSNVNTIKAIFSMGSESTGQRRILLQRNALFEANGFNADFSTTSNVLTAGEWQQLVVIYQSYTVATGISLCRNGQVLAGTTSGGSSLQAFSNRTATFAANNAGTENWAGQIAEACVWNRALTASEVRTHYRLGPGWFGKLQPRRRYAVAQAATTNRRRRILIGASS